MEIVRPEEFSKRLASEPVEQFIFVFNKPWECGCGKQHGFEGKKCYRLSIANKRKVIDCPAGKRAGVLFDTVTGSSVLGWRAL